MNYGLFCFYECDKGIIDFFLLNERRVVRARKHPKNDRAEDIQVASSEIRQWWNHLPSAPGSLQRQGEAVERSENTNPYYPNNHQLMIKQLFLSHDHRSVETEVAPWVVKDFFCLINTLLNSETFVSISNDSQGVNMMNSLLTLVHNKEICFFTIIRSQNYTEEINGTKCINYRKINVKISLK